MDVRELQDHIGTLATLEESAAPLISCYLDAASGIAGYRVAFDERVHLLKKTFSGQALIDFGEAAGRIDALRCIRDQPGHARCGNLRPRRQAPVLPGPPVSRAGSELDCGWPNPEHLSSDRD